MHACRLLRRYSFGWRARRFGSEFVRSLRPRQFLPRPSRASNLGGVECTAPHSQALKWCCASGASYLCRLTNPVGPRSVSKTENGGVGCAPFLLSALRCLRIEEAVKFRIAGPCGRPSRSHLRRAGAGHRAPRAAASEAARLPGQAARDRDDHQGADQDGQTERQRLAPEGKIGHVANRCSGCGACRRGAPRRLSVNPAEPMRRVPDVGRRRQGVTGPAGAARKGRRASGRGT